jgi:hypothetical protein
MKFATLPAIKYMGGFSPFQQAVLKKKIADKLHHHGRGSPTVYITREDRAGKKLSNTG